MQSIEECVVIKEKVKKYIAEQNACEGVAGSGSSDTKAPPIPATEVPGDNNTGASGGNATQDGVDN